MLPRDVPRGRRWRPALFQPPVRLRGCRLASRGPAFQAVRWSVPAPTAAPIRALPRRGSARVGTREEGLSAFFGVVSSFRIFYFSPSLFIHPVPSSASTVPHCCPCLYFCSLVSLEEKDARCTFTSQELRYLIGTEPYFYPLYQVVYSCVKYVRVPPGWAPAVLHSSLPFLISDFSFR